MHSPQIGTSATCRAADLANVLGDEPDIGKQGSGWGQTTVIDILRSKVLFFSTFGVQPFSGVYLKPRIALNILQSHAAGGPGKLAVVLKGRHGAGCYQKGVLLL